MPHATPVTLEAGALELFFEVAEGEAQRGGAAVGAVAGAIDEFAAGEQRFDLAGGERVSGFDGGFARHHVEDFVEHLLFGEVEELLFAALEEVGDELGGAEFFQKRWERMDGEGVGGEGGDFDAEAIQ